MMKKIFALLIATMIFMTACQPTPEKEVVIPRDNTEKMVIEAAKSEDETSVEATEEKPVFQYETPEHVSERFSVIEGTLDISIDADVSMPDIDSVPVAKVISSPFTQERADELREYFMQDGRLVTEYVRTKADYDEMIIEAKRGHEVDGEMVFDEGSQRVVDKLIKERAEAPDEDVANIITDYSIDTENGYSGRLIINGEERGSLYGRKDMFGYNSEKMHRVDDHNIYDDNGELMEIPVVDIAMSEQEAIDAAQALLQELGITDMAVKEIHKAYFYTEYDLQSVPEFGGYHMEFMREFGGVLPINIKGFGIGREDKFEVSPPINVERIDIAIDDMGNIRTFRWKNPIEIVETLTEHVDILPFEDIMARLRDFSKIQWAFMDGYANTVLMVNKIYKIDFSLVYLPIKNNATEFMYAPCWAFAYRTVPEYTKEQKEDIQKRGIIPIHEDEMGTEYLIFSAVDGASISPYSSETYEESQRMREEHEAENS
jgi:hypothetical protein